MTSTPPPFDEELAQSYVGKYVLIGLTYQDPRGKLIKQEQMHGVIQIADPIEGIVILLKGKSEGQIYRLPPGLRTYQAAAKDEYRLRSTGETINDPDLLCTWTITCSDA